MHESPDTAPRRHSRLDRLADERAVERAGRIPGEWLWAAVRIALGFIFLWTFVDKLFGMGRGTSHDRAWIRGGSPTSGYLGHVTGPLGSVFRDMSGKRWPDWLYMIGFAGLGIALILGIGMIIAAVGGTLLLATLYASNLPVESNPFVDLHVIYALTIIALAVTRVGERYGLGRWWARTALVRALPFLR
jgi:thiosulfate dehydrogenase [quinone] large subunit